MISILILILFLAILSGTYFGIKIFDPFGIIQEETQQKMKSVAHFSDSESSDSDSDNSVENEIIEREFTVDSLKPYNGEDEKNVYVSLKGQVFDVTGSGYFGRTSDYNIFAGHDASINMARSSLDTTTLNNFDLSVLSNSELMDLDSNVEFYERNYEKVGWLKEFFEANPKSSFNKKND